MMKVPYLLVVGEKEETNKTVNVRDRKGEEKRSRSRNLSRGSKAR